MTHLIAVISDLTDLLIRAALISARTKYSRQQLQQQEQEVRLSVVSVQLVA